ncbi:Acetate/butyrate--CoA ligase AAE7, peroxisomal [Golovinomyces cichoracearum]|uniref:Acetate/butyrate--CoA ligase AAE7, peroxisomal n=1 Tax=Golovinomyces cichoracearum TaxID=62708 RepID=A0A420IAE5_9PEZI|nr:Acetate/butyrate--CoA ligase AAE7, peroxisomal [Golovinomyces cichoracearum]
MSLPISRLNSILSQLATSSSPRPYIHALSPTSFLPRAAQIDPNALAIYHITTDDVIIRRTYSEFADRARGLAYYFVKHGFKQIGILASNTPAFLESIFAAGAAGGIHIGANYRLKPGELAYIFELVEVDCIVVDAEYEPLLENFKKQNPNVHLIIDTDTGKAQSPFNEAIAEGLIWDLQKGENGWVGLNAYAVSEDACIAVPFTSGTTDKPKGVVYTHRGAYLAALANVIESGLAFEGGKRCGYLWTLPMFHAVGWTFPWAVTAARGTHYCLRKIDYFYIWKLLKSGSITHFNAAPTVNTFLCASEEAACLTSPVRVTIAASPPSPYLLEQMSKLNLVPTHVYGLTETYGPITKSYIMPEWASLSTKERFFRMARQGHGFITSLPIRIIKTNLHEGVLVDVQKDGQEIGEIVFSGNICAKEYFKDPAATQKLWAGGVLHSGDLAVWHPDGSAQILDRKKDIIISGGENISSLALEAVLVQHPAILEAAVVGVPDVEWGEKPVAFIVPKITHQTSSTQVISSPSLTSDHILDWIKNESPISRFMVPRKINIVSELPMTSSGKVRKDILRQWALGKNST